MTLELFLILIIVVLAVALFLAVKKGPGQSFLMIQEQINNISKVLDSKLSQSADIMQNQFGQSAKIISQVTEKLTKLDQTNQQVVGFAEQLQSLENILKNPKQRGILGEYYLETVLKNVLPPNSYQMQYGFKDGLIADAVVFVGKFIIPVDSKFSLENYNRMIETKDMQEKKRLETLFVSDLKKRIEETSKYIKPEENTMDFAFMFIPSEAVYYDLLINKIGAIISDTQNLLYYAGRKRVIVVSPTSFLAYLQTVLQGLKNQKISEEAREIIKQVEKLGKHLFAFSDYFNKLGNHLETAVSTYNKSGKEFLKIDKDVVKISGGEAKIEIGEIEGPIQNE